MWYIAALCETMGLDMGSIAVTNILKLKERFPDGFSHEASNNRKVEE